MMESLRNAGKTWVAKLLVGLLAVSFGVWGIADVFRGSAGSTLATVGETTISADQYNRAFQEYLQALSRQTGQGLTPEQARTMGIDRAVLDSLVQTAALDDEAQRLDLGVSNEFLAQTVMRNEAFRNAQGVFDANRFKDLLAQNGLTEAGFFADERQRRLRQALTDTASTAVPVNSALLEAQYRYETEQRDARYFIVSSSDTEVAAPTDEEITKEYEANPSAYTAPEYRSVAIMKVEPSDIAAAIVLTDQDVSDGYEKYKGDYFTPEKRTIIQLSFPTEAEAASAKQKIDSGTDFLALATERGFTEKDITFADKTRDDLIDPTIAEAAFSLPVGTVSDTVKGNLSTVLIKVVSITPEHQSTLAEVRSTLEERLRLDRANEEIQSIYDAVEDARAAQTTFEDIAAKANIPFQLIGSIDASGKSKDGTEPTVPHKAQVVEAAYASDVGVETDALVLDNGYVWYEVREVIPAALKPLEAVKSQATAAVTANKVRALSEEKAKALLERARSGTPLETLATESKATLETAQGLRRTESSDRFPPAAVAALFAVPNNGFAYSLEPDGRSARLMQAEPVLLPAFDPGSPEGRAIADRLKPKLSDNLLTAYLGAIEKDAGVSINEPVWQSIAGEPTN
ncbi:SurA N-terminal domain-containing protein [Aestuariivirga sp.]|jgi:peptidyl-prolyl cis-trans isomerase D|uniref:peptidylprolyl isomerase n=1 Tax=Aestuariivirga sp. TaxID=2650926 RepID=UPI003783F687